MSLLQMNISAFFLVGAIIIIRTAALNRLPKTMFLILWGVVVLRLIVPFTIPSRLSVYNAINGIVTNMALEQRLPESSTDMDLKNSDITAELNYMSNTLDTYVFPNTPAFTEEIKENAAADGIKTVDKTEPAEPQEIKTEGKQPNLIPLEAIKSIPLLVMVWFAGMLIMASYFTLAYIKNIKELKLALPIVKNSFIDEWLADNKLLRAITVLQSDKITTPIAVGIIKPRIILPKMTDMDDLHLLRYIFTHEYYHIKRFDMLWKLMLIFVLCVNWFNPMVWVMFILANRDLELTCDEMVIRRFGAEDKATYAYSIIGMAERRMKFAPLYNGFSRNATEERIRAIMKYKKTSLFAILTAIILVIGTTTAFAFSGSINQAKAQAKPANFKNADNQGSLSESTLDKPENYEFYLESVNAKKLKDLTELKGKLNTTAEDNNGLNQYAADWDQWAKDMEQWGEDLEEWAKNLSNSVNSADWYSTNKWGSWNFETINGYTPEELKKLLYDKPVLIEKSYKDVSKITTNLFSDSIVVKRGGDKVNIKFYEWTKDEYKLTVDNDGTLTLEYAANKKNMVYNTDSKGSVNNNGSTYINGSNIVTGDWVNVLLMMQGKSPNPEEEGAPSRVVEITLPNSVTFESVELYTTSGNINIEGCNIRSVKQDTASGNVSISNCTAVTILQDTASGNANISDCTSSSTIKQDTASGSVSIKDSITDNINQDTASGNASAANCTADKITQSTASGMITISSGSLKKINAGSTSGNIRITEVLDTEDIKLRTTSSDAYIELFDKADNYKIAFNGTAVSANINGKKYETAEKSINLHAAKSITFSATHGMLTVKDGK